jgi:hypothetical protein
MTGDNTPASVPDFAKLLNEAVAPIIERLTELEKQDKILNSSAEEITKFKAERAAEAATKQKETYRKLLNAGAQADFDKLFPEMEKDLAGFLAGNPDKLFHPVQETKLGGKILNSDGSEFNLKAEQAKLFGY